MGFQEAVLEIGGSGGVAFDEVVARYAEPQRHYHTLEHIQSCLALLERFRLLAQRPAEVELALWFHDVVYDPRRTDNEERSADLARETLLSAGAPGEPVERIAGFILATKGHEGVEGDGALVLDIDLSILGASEEEFERFDRGIREEFNHVPSPLYRVGRRRVLEGFLKRERIYRLEPFFDALEEQARRNLERKIAELRWW